MPTPIVTERWSPKAVSYTSGQYTAAREFDVTGCNNENAALAALTAFDPTTRFNEKHPLNPWLYCTGQSSIIPGFNVYNIKVGYASSPAGRHPDPGAPLSEPVRFRWNQYCISEPTDRDSAGNLVTNRAGEPFADGFPCEHFGIRIIAVRNEATFDAQGAIDFGNSVNNSPVSYNDGKWSVQKGQSKVVSIEPISDITSVAPYVTVQYTIDLRGGFKIDSDGYADAFRLRIVNKGRRGWYTDSGLTQRGNIVEIVDGHAQKVSDDVLLDATGKPLFPEFKIAKTNLTGWADPVGIPSPPAFITETATYVAPGASGGVVFLKIFPDKIKLRDHKTLNL